MRTPLVAAFLLAACTSTETVDPDAPAAAGDSAGADQGVSDAAMGAPEVEADAAQEVCEPAAGNYAQSCAVTDAGDGTGCAVPYVCRFITTSTLPRCTVECNVDADCPSACGVGCGDRSICDGEGHCVVVGCE